MIENRTAELREPPELQRAIPRPVRLTPSGQVVTVTAFAFFAGAVLSAVLLASLAARDEVAYRRFQAGAVDALGTIIELGRPQGDDKVKQATYQYDAGGQIYTGRVRLRKREWRNLDVGSTIPVRYLAASPAVAYMRGHERRGVPRWVSPLVALGLTGTGALLLLIIRGQQNLAAIGRWAPARVVSANRSQHGRMVRYEYRTMGGSLRKGSFEARKAPEIGATLGVIYHPEKNSSAKYPLSLARVDVPEALAPMRRDRYRRDRR